MGALNSKGSLNVSTKNQGETPLPTATLQGESRDQPIGALETSEGKALPQVRSIDAKDTFLNLSNKIPCTPTSCSSLEEHELLVEKTIFKSPEKFEEDKEEGATDNCLEYDDFAKDLNLIEIDEWSFLMKQKLEKQEMNDSLTVQREKYNYQLCNPQS